MKECFLWENRCECNFQNIGYTVGWFGAIYRSVGIFTVAIKITELPEDDYLYTIFYSILLTYGFISLAINFIFIVGISKTQETYIVPYIALFGIECAAIFTILIVGIIIIVKIKLEIGLGYFIPGGVVILGLYVYLWTLIFCHYQKFCLALKENISQTSQTSDFRKYVKCSCGCFKSDSLDIVTYQ